MAQYAPWGSLPMVRELLDHIDELDERVSALLFTNGVLDSAAKDAQAWLYRAQTAEAKCAQLEAQRGGAVVVPELTDRDLYDAWLKCDYGLEEESIYHEGVRDGHNLALSRIQSIPADRVLADGMVGVDREEVGALRSFYEIVSYHMMAEGGIPMSDALGSAMDTLDEIRDRAQQAKWE